MTLEDYKEIVATAASITTVAQFFAGMFICKDIVKKGSTANVSCVPFIGGSAMGILMLQYSRILNDPAMTFVNVVGVSLNLCYVLCYYIYSENKREMQKQIFYTTSFVASLIAYAFWEDPDLVEFRYGIIVTTMLMLLLASPLLSLGDVIQTKSTETLPFPLILSATIVTFLWLLYGIIIKNPFIQFQNVVGFTLCSLQLSLFAIYPSRPQEKNKKKN